MQLFATIILSGTGVDYAEMAVTCLLWAAIGLFVVSPILFADALYQSRKVGNAYHYRKGFHLKRRHHAREARFFGLISLMAVGFTTGISLL